MVLMAILFILMTMASGSSCLLRLSVGKGEKKRKTKKSNTVEISRHHNSLQRGKSLIIHPRIFRLRLTINAVAIDKSGFGLDSYRRSRGHRRCYERRPWNVCRGAGEETRDNQYSGEQELPIWGKDDDDKKDGRRAEDKKWDDPEEQKRRLDDSSGHV